MRRPSLGRWGQALRTPVGIVALVGVCTIVALAVFAPLLWSGEAARIDIPAASQGASLAHPLGTDALGRDIFTESSSRRGSRSRSRFSPPSSAS